MTRGEGQGEITNSRSKIGGAITPINYNEIIEDIESQIRKCGGV
jgi:hypothetical protein